MKKLSLLALLVLSGCNQQNTTPSAPNHNSQYQKHRSLLKNLKLSLQLMTNLLCYIENLITH
nr:hypothetical protein [Vibrio harveyi]